MKKYLFIALALAGANAFSVSAEAANACPNLFLTNATGSPPVVSGSVVSFIVNGIAPTADIYYDGSYLTSVTEVFTPPGQWFTAPSSIQGVAPGAHTLRNGIEACTVNFNVISAPSNPTMTQGWTSWQEGSDIYITTTQILGFLRGSFGAMSPTTTSSGKTYENLMDQRICSIFGCSADSSLTISGFTSDPGKAWLTSVSAVGNTKMGAASSYWYSNGTATWSWNNETFGFTGAGTTAVTVTHN